MNKPQPITETITLNDGRTITIETGKLAKQADGSVVVRMGDTMLLATAVASHDVNPDIDFLPLTVDYREKFSSAGKFPGGFFKREGRPSTEEILVMRLVDRVLRPLFPKDYHAETQVMIQLMSFDENVQADSLAGLAASAALAVSDIPFEGPISEVRVAKINGELKINPSLKEMEEATIDLMVGGTADSVTMVEGQMEEVQEEEMIEAIEFAHQAIKNQIEGIKKLADKIEKAKVKRDYDHAEEDEELYKQIEQKVYPAIYDIAKEGLGKQERSEKFSKVKEELMESFSEEEKEEKGKLISSYFDKVKKKAVRELMLNEGIRLDGRSTTEIRPIWTEIDYLPSVHGSAIFTRGETQALATVTLGTSRDINIIDGATMQGEERFYLHYNFPPFSTGEARPLRGTSRREIGHGHLAQRALEPVVPEDTPYTIRVVSEILESNGSSSMATVCAGSMALMDAGIKIKKPVSGIAMGLIYDEETGKYVVLSDILGDEDHLGDMDFKVTGTKDGITACQMDIKIKDLKRDILEKALHQAKEGRLHIMGEMEKTISEPRAQVKDFVPKMVKIEIDKDYIGAVIGKGGKDIQQLQEDTDTTIVIDEVDGKGVIEIMGTDMDKIQKVLDRIAIITFEPEVGEVYEGKVKSIKDFGAFVEIAPGMDGLLHISEIDWKRVNKVEDELSEGDVVKVKLIGKDPRTGKLKLSRKVLMPRPPREDNKKNDNQE
jgi:polyribonucleotide nucleotidyltransferase